jgi:hypothetical protein
MIRDDWRTIDTAPEGVTVMTKIHDCDGARNEQRLKRQGRLWFYPDMSMYVYYTPTHWQPELALSADEELAILHTKQRLIAKVEALHHVKDADLIEQLVRTVG